MKNTGNCLNLFFISRLGKLIFFSGLLIVLVLIVFSQRARAVPGNQTRIQTQDLLIGKLKGIFSGLPENSPDRVKVGLRLADLHAERGRLQAKKELEKGCIECTGGQEDRKQALMYYHYVLPHLDSNQLQIVLIQVGHLHELVGQNSKAIDLYRKVVDGSRGLLKAEAEFSLAEIYFKQRDFRKAGSHYQRTLAEDSFKRRGLAGFRLAWCLYNTGDVLGAVSGLEKMLKTPELLTRNREILSGVDEDFKAEIARDYTVFMAHNQQVDLQAIGKVFELSPDGENQILNVSFLARELERLGQIQQSEQAWKLVVEKADQLQVRIDALINLASLSFRTGGKEKLFSYFQRALSQWKSLLLAESKTEKSLKKFQSGKLQGIQSTEQVQSGELKMRLRNIVFDWNRDEKKTPSKELIMAYEAYFEVDSKDAEAFKLASQTALLAEDFSRAYHWNGKAMSLTRDNKVLESLLLRGIEIAEKAKNPQWLTASQNLYLEKSVERSKLSEVRYQIAQVHYENKNYEVAAGKFQKLAKYPSASSKLKLQSAEMALDCLVFTKDDSTIETWGREFAKSFPDQKKHFLGLVGQAVLSQAARLSSDHEKAWTVLSRFDVSYADPGKVKTYYENKIILSRQLNKFREMEESLQAFLALDNITDKERRFALENKVWLDETQLDFNDAYLSYKKLEMDDWLRLAHLADLAEKPSEKYYFKYLKTTQDPKLAFSICFKLVEKSGTLKGPYQSCVSHLKKDREVFASLIIDTYGGKGPLSPLFNRLKTHGLEKTWLASVVSRGLLLKRGETWLKKLERHKLGIGRLARSIQQRLNLINRFERVIGDATKTEDWLVQVVFLDHLKTQYTRFYEDLMALPVSGDLGEKEKQEFMTLLSEQVTPYKLKADRIQLKIDELWKDQNSQDRLYADFHKSSLGVQALLGPQIEKLGSVKSSSGLLNLVYRQNGKRQLSSVSSLEAAREQVRKTPMDKKALKKLVELETIRGYQPMIIYLSNRLEKMD